MNRFHTIPCDGIQKLAPALFSRLRARSKKERESAKKKEHEKAKAQSTKEKKREFALSPPSHTGSPVPEPKYTRQGEKKGS